VVAAPVVGAVLLPLAGIVPAYDVGAVVRLVSEIVSVFQSALRVVL
jgi:hypothetical protein